METIIHIPFNVLLQHNVWFQDEARFGQQNHSTKIWASKGTRPRVVKQQFEYGYLFGAVCSKTGQTEGLISPLVNKKMMTEHLSQISQATPDGEHAVVIMDGVGWHTLDIGKPFNNAALMKRPLYSPELKPIEQVSRAWHVFISDSNRVKRLCNRSWINLVK